jgi:hypothetical protein
MRFLFFYLMTDDPDRVRRVAAQHSAYWGQQALAGYLGGPFADRSGGLITFESDTPALLRILSPVTRSCVRAASAAGG